ncbi:MAG: helix-hairpin-helix domain-containing protein [Intestinibacter sp.]|uniref:helix-hairpin-helix domain-containing protein n=1 Tax=Intestinibacter sp. TaxID=1965304 RepID=UPI003F18EF8A
MQNKSKIVAFVVVILISIGGLLCKGYFTDEIYVLNGDESTEASEENIQDDEALDENTTSENKIKDESKDDKNISVKEITVYVSGEVNNPGIVTLKSDQRLADAVKMLGGVTKKADMNNINLAIKLEDEMHYIIPKKGDKSNSSNQNLSNNTSNRNSNLDSNQANSSNTNKININTAGIQELDAIPGVGEATANKILSYREENGNFRSIEEIKNVNGIGDKKYENMKESICVN